MKWRDPLAPKGHRRCNKKLTFFATVVCFPGMDKRLIDEDWKYLCQYLPEDLSELAKATGTVKRWRNVKNGEE